jgi:Flp pilus assembly pilin Flp
MLMRRVVRFFDRLAADELGATMVEYTILIGLISIVAILIIVAMAPKISAIWTNVNTAMQNAVQGS